MKNDPIINVPNRVQKFPKSTHPWAGKYILCMYILSIDLHKYMYKTMIYAFKLYRRYIRTIYKKTCIQIIMSIKPRDHFVEYRMSLK